MAEAAEAKSGLRHFRPNETIFKQGDSANSLFIIQKGQIRLYIPKGKGFVELAMLRTGEVIGEMAYFDEKASRRSCSADATVPTDVVEISFVAFGKTMQALNPWFKTIINTLAERLRKTNEKVKALENNSVGYAVGGGKGDYKFFQSVDIMKMLSLLHLSFNTFGELKEGKYCLHINKLRYYLLDVFNVGEIKVVEFMKLLEDEGFVEIGMDDTGLPKIVKVANPEVFRTISAFLGAQRLLDDSKKLKISSKCERFLKRIMDQFIIQGVQTDVAVANISELLEDFKERNVPIFQDDIADAVFAGLCDDIVVGETNNLTSTVQYASLKKLYPYIKLTNAIKRINDSKVLK